MRASVHVSSTILGAIALLVGHRTRPDPEPAVRGHSHDDTNPGEPRCESRDAELGEDTQRDAAHASCATTRTPRFLRYYRPASAIGKARRGPARPAPPNAASARGGRSEGASPSPCCKLPCDAALRGVCVHLAVLLAALSLQEVVPSSRRHQACEKQSCARWECLGRCARATPRTSRIGAREASCSLVSGLGVVMVCGACAEGATDERLRGA